MNLEQILSGLYNELLMWYEGERPSPGEEPLRYAVCAGLAVLEIMREIYPLNEQDYITDKNQVRTSGKTIKKILERQGETRTYAREGGRTTRGTRPAAERLVSRLNNCACSEMFATLNQNDRLDVIDSLQGWLVDKVKEYFERKKIEVEIHLSKPSWQIIADILSMADKRKVAGPVSQHLVGAKLAIRYPHLIIDNHSYTTADQQLNRPGDFIVGDTAFHVTVSPTPSVFEKCALNVRHGYRAVVLTRENKVLAARQMAESAGLDGKVGVTSIEQFVGQNVEEMAEFGKESLAAKLFALLQKYNERVREAETEQSLLIEIPENLVGSIGNDDGQG